MGVEGFQASQNSSGRRKEGGGGELGISSHAAGHCTCLHARGLVGEKAWAGRWCRDEEVHLAARIYKSPLWCLPVTCSVYGRLAAAVAAAAASRSMRSYSVFLVTGRSVAPRLKLFAARGLVSARD